GRGRLVVDWEDQEAANELVQSIVDPAAHAARKFSTGHEEQTMPKRPPDPKKVRMEVAPPAVGLALTALFASISITGLAVWGLERLMDRGGPWGNRTEVFLCAIAAIPFATAIAYLFAGAMQMLRLRSYPSALAAGILAVIPWSPAWVLGLPFGIWTLVVLPKP